MGGAVVCVASPNPRIDYRSCPIGPGFGRAGPAWSRKGVSGARPAVPVDCITPSLPAAAAYIRNHPASG